MKKNIFIITFLLNFCFLQTSLIAYGNQNLSDWENINQFLQKNKKQDFANWWVLVRNQFPIKDRIIIDRWVLANPIAKWPNLNMQLFHSGKGNQFLRVLLEQDKKMTTYEIFEPDLSTLKFNGKSLTLKKINSNESLLRAIHDERFSNSSLFNLKMPFAITLSENEQLGLMAQYRLLFETSQKIIENEKKPKVAKHNIFLFNLLSINSCYAKTFNEKDSSCVTKGGFIGFSAPRECSVSKETISSFQSEKFKGPNDFCASGQVLCHPYFYGYSSKGQIHCVKSETDCQAQAELKTKEDVKKLFSNIKENSADKSFKLPEQIETYINQAAEICEKKWSSNCNELMKRYNVMIDYFMNLKKNQQQATKSDLRDAEAVNGVVAAANVNTKPTETKEECGWICENKGWLFPSLTVAGVSLVAGYAICKWTSKSLFGICPNKTNGTGLESTEVLSLPAAPTTADYSTYVAPAAQ